MTPLTSFIPHITIGKTWKTQFCIDQRNRNFCTCDLALRHWHACDYHTFKRPIVKNKTYYDRTPKLNMAFVGAFQCDYTPFMASHEIRSYSSQPSFTCSKLTMETLEKQASFWPGVVLVSLQLTLKIFHTFFQCFYC